MKFCFVAGMSQIFVEIDRQAKTARFYGPGTFAAKDSIKSLGRARWMREEKAWVISSFTLTFEELRKTLPQITLAGEVSSDNEISEVCETPPAANDVLPQGLSVGELVQNVDRALQQAFPHTILVYGVIIHLKRYGDRVYLSIADIDRPDDTLDCVIWNNEEALCAELNKAGFTLEPDLQVMFEVSVGMNRKRGSVSLSIRRVVAEYTVAKLAALRERTNQRLKDEGLFEKNKSLRLPFFPRRLGVLTSSGGTVIHDFLASLNEAQFGFEVFWAPVSVQGQGAKKSIIAGLGALQELGLSVGSNSSTDPRLDVILLFRGGGSAADLAVFNDYEVARAICQCKIPVVSAIGHQEDQSSAQDVSCLALGVPKDVGRYFADIVRVHRENFSDYRQTIVVSGLELLSKSSERFEDRVSGLYHLASQSVTLHRRLLFQLLSHLPATSRAQWQNQLTVLGNTSELLRRLGQRQVSVVSQSLLQISSALRLSGQQLRKRCWVDLRYNARALRTNFVQAYSKGVLQLEGLERVVQDARPEVQLERGYALIRSQGDIRTKAKQLRDGEAISIQFSDGQVSATASLKDQESK